MLFEKVSAMRKALLLNERLALHWAFSMFLELQDEYIEDATSRWIVSEAEYDCATLYDVFYVLWGGKFLA